MSELAAKAFAEPETVLLAVGHWLAVVLPRSSSYPALTSTASVELMPLVLNVIVAVPAARLSIVVIPSEQQTTSATAASLDTGTTGRGAPAGVTGSVICIVAPTPPVNVFWR